MIESCWHERHRDTKGIPAWRTSTVEAFSSPALHLLLASCSECQVFPIAGVASNRIKAPTKIVFIPYSKAKAVSRNKVTDAPDF